MKLRLQKQNESLPLVAAAPYEGFAKQLVLAQKSAKDPKAMAYFATLLLEMMPAEWRTLPLVWVPPTTWAPVHLNECIGAALAARGFTVWGAGPLKRRLQLMPQKSKGLVARLRGSEDIYASRPRWRLPASSGKGIILLDDIVTTGATLQSCTAALADAGLAVHGALVLAATPSQRGSGSPLLRSPQGRGFS